jgi:hypothetical protein
MMGMEQRYNEITSQGISQRLTTHQSSQYGGPSLTLPNEYDALKTRADKLEKALEFYADEKKYRPANKEDICDIAQDDGETARAALEEYRG